MFAVGVSLHFGQFKFVAAIVLEARFDLFVLISCYMFLFLYVSLYSCDFLSFCIFASSNVFASSSICIPIYLRLCGAQAVYRKPSTCSFLSVVFLFPSCFYYFPFRSFSFPARLSCLLHNVSTPWLLHFSHALLHAVALHFCFLPFAFFATQVGWRPHID